MKENHINSKFMVHPLHHLSLNSYTTLASAYKVRASDLLSVDSEIDLNQSEAFKMSRISAAYFLLLAGAAHHLFISESSLIASVANFWIAAGESLLTLTRNSGWSKFVNFDFVRSNLTSDTNFECSKCSLIDRFKARALNGQIESEEYENVSYEFIHCVSDITPKVWSFLVYGCDFLKLCKDPINLNWLTSSESDTCYTHESENVIGVCDQAYNDHTGAHILQLGGHCLTYGGFTGLYMLWSSIPFGLSCSKYSRSLKYISEVHMTSW
jgi:SET and MYND domain-containing protein